MEHAPTPDEPDDAVDNPPPIAGPLTPPSGADTTRAAAGRGTPHKVTEAARRMANKAMKKLMPHENKDVHEP